MLVVMVRIPVGSPEEGARIENRFRNRAGVVDTMPGFGGFELLKGEGEYISVSRWASQADLDHWMQSQANAQAHAQVPQPTGGGHPQGDSSGHQHSEGGESQPPQRGAGPQGSSVTVYSVVSLEAEQA